MWYTTYVFEDGARYTPAPDSDIYLGMKEGRWTRPFPNESGNSYAFGSIEVLASGDIGSLLIDRHGDIVEVVCAYKYRCSDKE